MTAARLQDHIDGGRPCGSSALSVRQSALERLSGRLGAKVTDLAEIHAELAALLLTPPPPQNAAGGST